MSFYLTLLAQIIDDNFKSIKYSQYKQREIYISTYMKQIKGMNNINEFNGKTHSAIEELTKVRDNLIVLLLGSLSYNRLLLGNFFNSVKTQPDMKVPVVAKQVKHQETQESYQKVKFLTLKKNKKIRRRRPSQKQRISSIKNDTKNIPKNYGKAILTFILKSTITVKVVSMLGLNMPQFFAYIRKLKNKINSIDGLRRMWGSEEMENKTKKCTRILSYYFMRRHCLKYIFYSKVRNFSTHIKYRQKLIQGIENPLQFSHIKDY